MKWEEVKVIIMVASLSQISDRSIHQSRTLEVVNKINIIKVVGKVCKILAMEMVRMLVLPNQFKAETIHYRECSIFIEIEGILILE